MWGSLHCQGKRVTWRCRYSPKVRIAPKKFRKRRSRKFRARFTITLLWFPPKANPDGRPALMADSWDSSLYDDRHSFVWRAGASLVEMLRPEPGERILDLGCGTGHLTAKIAESGASVIGLDSSLSMIAQARQNFPALKFVLSDARSFRFDEPFDAVFSNAALHWIHDAEAVVRCVRAALRPGGRFVLEMGVKGNVGRIRQAIEDVLAESGRAPKCPWFYPSAGE